ncbi:MAG: Ig domain-containing protein [Chloroflexi bacterium]|nr:Ig domain-containing protein [Chloroflexota bacterium]
MLPYKEYRQTKMNCNKVNIFLIRAVTALILLAAGIIFITPGAVQAAGPVITSTPPNGLVGTSYNFLFSATCNGTACPSPSWLIAGYIPPGLVVVGNAITGIPTTPGPYAINVTVTDTTFGPSAPTPPFIINITAPALTFTSSSIPGGMVGQSYSANIVATGGTGTITYALTSGALPAGLALSSTGSIAGAPGRGTAGTYMFTVTAASGTTTAQQSFSMTIDRGTYEAVVSISPDLAEGQTRLYVDNAIKATMRGGESVRLRLDPDATVTVSVDQVVNNPSRTDVRYKAESSSASISEGVSQVRFTYFPEYSIDLLSDPSGIVSVSGSGWYREGSTLTVSAPDGAPKDTESQYRFAYWLAPGGDKIRSQTLNFAVTAPGKYIATYEVFIKFDVVSKYGNVQGSGWYKSGTAAKWSIAPVEVAMPGIMGFFGGKFKAVLTSGTETIEGPKTINVDWESDYGTPAVTIPITILIIAGIIYGLYSLSKRDRAPQMAPYPPPPMHAPPPPLYQAYPPPPPPFPPQAAMPPPQTTVVMIGDGLKKSPQTTREQLMEKFGELLQKYEDELASGQGMPGSPELPEFTASAEKKSLPAPEIITTVESSAEKPSTDNECGFSTKKLLRTTVTHWKNTSIKAIAVTPGDKKSAALAGGRTVTWTRETYNEWELHVCKLREGHKGTHKGSTEIVYSLLETNISD